MQTTKGLPRRRAFDWRAYRHTYAKLGVYLITLALFGGANVCLVLWQSPDLQLKAQAGEIGSSREVLLLGLLSTFMLYATALWAERVGIVPYGRFKAYLCTYRLSFYFMLAALLFMATGFGNLVGMGRQGKDRCGSRSCPKGCCVTFEELKPDGARFGDWFRAVDGYVALEQARVVAYTQELHRLREGDELYAPTFSDFVEDKPKVSNKTTIFAQPEDLVITHDPNAPSRYHQIPPPWITIEVEPLPDILQTVTVAPIFSHGEVCLERPPPTNQVCLKRNRVIGIAVKFSEGLCRQIGSTTCQNDWDMMQIKPRYKCDPNQEYDIPGKENDLYDSGVCGRIVEPQRAQAVLMREGLKRIYADGWSFNSPVSLDPKVRGNSGILVVDVEEDECISGAEGCIRHYSTLGYVGITMASIAAALVLFTAGADTFHDYLLRQVMLIDEKELDLQRKVRRAVEADKLRTLETMQFEQSMQMQELEAMGRDAVETKPGTKPGAAASMFAPLQPGAVPPV